MDVIPLNANLVRGSHGRVGTPVSLHPVIISSKPLQKTVSANQVYDILWEQLL
jgi:hypothetical protein